MQRLKKGPDALFFLWFMEAWKFCIFAEKKKTMDEYTEQTLKAMVFIGNGFDVAHGYKTSYKDFYENCKELKRLSQQGNRLCKHIIDNVDGELWKDLEYGLYEYSKQITADDGIDNKQSSERFKTEFKELKNALFLYLKEEINTSKSGNPGYLVGKIAQEWDCLDYQIVSFNYTHIIAAYSADAKLYNSNLSFNKEKIIFQHGSIYNPEKGTDNPTDNIVLGIDDIQKVEKAHSFLYKSRQKIFNITDLMNYINKKDVYIIYGCSMGQTDDFYFRKLFEGKKDKLFIIYGYGENALNEVMDNVCAYTGGLNPYQIDNNNEVVPIDCRLSNAASKTKEALNRWKVRKTGTFRV